MPLVPEYFPDISGFQWDEANSDKNWHRHSVSMSETEQVFLNHLFSSRTMQSTPRRSCGTSRWVEQTPVGNLRSFSRCEVGCFV